MARNGPQKGYRPNRSLSNHYSYNTPRPQCFTHSLRGSRPRFRGVTNGLSGPDTGLLPLLYYSSARFGSARRPTCVVVFRSLIRPALLYSIVKSDRPRGESEPVVQAGLAFGCTWGSNSSCQPGPESKQTLAPMILSLSTLNPALRRSQSSLWNASRFRRECYPKQRR